MEYFRHGPYLDVEFEDDPPLGAKHVKAELLNGVEDMLSFTSSELNGRLSAGELSATYLNQTEADERYALKGSGGGGASFTEDPARPGIYILEVA